MLIHVRGTNKMIDFHQRHIYFYFIVQLTSLATHNRKFQVYHFMSCSIVLNESCLLMVLSMPMNVYSSGIFYHLVILIYEIFNVTSAHQCSIIIHFIFPCLLCLNASATKISSYHLPIFWRRMATKRDFQPLLVSFLFKSFTKETQDR